MYQLSNLSWRTVIAPLAVVAEYSCGAAEQMIQHLDFYNV